MKTAKERMIERDRLFLARLKEKEASVPVAEVETVVKEPKVATKKSKRGK